jgi:hypothetical protein
MKIALSLLFTIACQIIFAQGNKKATVPPRIPKWRHAYHQSLVMKIMNGVVDKDGSAKVICSFEKTLSLIKDMDRMTLGVPKILYLTGWQYNGHDDKYPAFFEVNNALKRPQDKNGRESLEWLVKEAKRYHTTVSLHINMTDAYDDSPLWKTYVDNDLISKNADGSLKVIGTYNNRKAYQINYRNEWEKGFAQKRVDSLLSLLPWLKKAGTIHLDAWYARPSEGHHETKEMEIAYQKKVAQYWHSKGIDPTNEIVLDYLTGLVPWCYHFNYRTQADYLNVPAAMLSGTHMNPDVTNSDFGLEFLFGTSTYGEKSFPGEWSKTPEENWESNFCENFFLNFPQYYFLNRLKRIKVEETGVNRTAYFSRNVKVSLSNSCVYENGRLLRRGSTICFPAYWMKDNSQVAFSTKDTSIVYRLPATWPTTGSASIFVISKDGTAKLADIPVQAGSIDLGLKAHVPILIRPSKPKRD